MRLKHTLQRLATLGLLLMSTAAQAQAPSNIQAEAFEPWYGQGTAILNTIKTDLVGHLQPTAGLFFHVSDGLAEERRIAADGTETPNRIIGKSFKLELSLGMGLFDWVDIGIVVPLVLSQDLNGNTATLPERVGTGDFDVQDPRIGLRVRLLRPEWAAGFGIALAANIYIPTGNQKEFTGDSDVRVEPRLAVDWRQNDWDFSIAANVAIQLRPKRVLNNVVNGYGFRWNVGTQIPLGVDGLHLLGNVFGTLGLESDLDPGDITKSGTDNSSPIEIDAGLQYNLKKYNLVFQAGAGAGLVAAVGAPEWRAFASISYTPMDGDRDGDGISDALDQCPDVKEDIDSYQDTDGCPDPDNDSDEILDVDDKCPLEPEDRDQFEDEDGCPDPDNDKDKILDVKDKCPLNPEDYDKFEDTDGCPDPDNDKDGVLDVDDKCPMIPEDRDGWEDADGCPDPDNDKDGILDVNDKCPNSPETKNGFQDADGCPDAKPKPNAKVQVTGRYVTIKGKVHFATSKAKIKSKSFALLNEVADVLNAYKQITKLRIEGHTDSRGSTGYNRRLSDSRAKSVRKYLIARGIAASRLQAIGYGEERPKVPNVGKKNYQINRRVDFFIMEIDGKAVGKDEKVKVD